MKDTRITTAPTVCIDRLLQDTYWLVISLNDGAGRPHDPDLRKHCEDRVLTVNQQLEPLGMSEDTRQRIGYAHCALLDETVLRHAAADLRDAWAGRTLQAQFFDRHQAGEQVYEDVRALLDSPTPSQTLLTLYHRMLALGFLGRYSRLDDPERLRLLAALEQRVDALAPGPLPGLVKYQAERLPAWLKSTTLHLVLAAGVVVLTWYALDARLAELAAGLPQVQG